MLLMTETVIPCPLNVVTKRMTDPLTGRTYESVIRLTAWLCNKFGLTSEQVIRHYDVTGKLCPLYYVEHEDAWQQFKADVDTAIQAGENNTGTQNTGENG